MEVEIDTIDLLIPAINGGVDAVLLDNGNVFITGGIDEYDFVLSQNEIFNPSCNCFEKEVGSLIQARSGPAVVELNNGKILVVGGHNSEGSTLKSSEL